MGCGSNFQTASCINSGASKRCSARSRELQTSREPPSHEVCALPTRSSQGENYVGVNAQTHRTARTAATEGLSEQETVLHQRLSDPTGNPRPLRLGDRVHRNLQPSLGSKRAAPLLTRSSRPTRSTR